MMMTHRLVRSVAKCRDFVFTGCHILRPTQACPFHSNTMLFCGLGAMSIEDTSSEENASAMAESSAILVSHAERAITDGIFAENGFKSFWAGEVEGDFVSKGSLSAMALRRLLDAQRSYLKELGVQLKAQGILLGSVQEEFSLLKSKPKTEQANLVGISNSLPAQESVEAVLDTAYKEEGSCKNDSHEGSQISTNACEGDSNASLSIERMGTIDTNLSQSGSEVQVSERLHWPEWALFLDRLRPFVHIQEGISEAASDNAEIFKDTALLKHALVKFAQTNESVFRMLSPKDLQMLVQCEYPKMDERTVVAKKRLQDYLIRVESEVSAPESSHASQAKLTDVMRLVYVAVRNLGGVPPSDSTSGLVHVLRALNSVSIVKPDGITAKEDASFVCSKDTKEEAMYSEMAPEIYEKPKVADLYHMQQDSGALEQTPNPSTSQDDVTQLEQPKYASIKERVDARRARLAKERLEKEAKRSVTEKQEKEAINSLLSKPFLSHKTGLKNSKKSRNDGEDGHGVVVRNFDAFDAIIDSDHSNDDIPSRIPRDNTRWVAGSSSVKRKAKAFLS